MLILHKYNKKNTFSVKDFTVFYLNIKTTTKYFQNISFEFFLLYVS